MIFSLKYCVKYTIVSHSEYLFIFSKLNIKSKTLMHIKSETTIDMDATTEVDIDSATINLN